MSKQNLVGMSEIQGLIIELRGQRVMLDSDLAQLYQVSTKRLIEQVKRNISRFPVDFMFQLTKEEWDFLKSQFATSGKIISAQKKKKPFVFTRNGANMLSAVLRSRIAILRSIQIMRAFTALEEIMHKKKFKAGGGQEILAKLSTHSKAIMHLFQKDQIKTKEIAKVKGVVNEMIDALKSIIFRLPD